MKTEQRTWTQNRGWTPASSGSLAQSAQLVLVFGATAVLQDPRLVDAIRKFYPAAHILGCSTAGEICGAQVSDDSLVATAVHFEHTQVRTAEVSLGVHPDSQQAGEFLARALPHSIGGEADGPEEKLAHVLVLSEIVATQQSYSGATSIVEPVQIKGLMEDALRMNTASMARHQITVIKEFADLPLLRLDRHLVLQILVNLIGNAKHAMDSVDDRSHQITLRTEITEPADGPRLRIRVEDDGEGITPENLLRLFAHGFTTRKNGHGFGLHSCALAAKEMAGTITAHSDGPGKGATFTLELPANPVAGLQ